MKTRVLFLLIMLSLVVFTPLLRGQLVSGSITGEVTDPAGAAIVGAEVQATNGDTGVQLSAKTNSAGYFSISNLIAGTYTVVLSAPGFKVLSQSGIVVDIGSVVRLDSKLEVGNVQEKVSVNGEAAVLQTDKVELGITIDSTQLVDLPSEGRNPTALATIQAGIVMSPGNTGVPSSESSSDYTFQANGNRSLLNRQLLDGVDDTEGVGGGPAIVPSTDQLQEYQLITSNYDIELGQAAGAMQLFTTKSGTNQLHGNVHEFNRVNYLSARNPFTEPNGPGHLVYNQFGGTLGGPILRDKLFAFGYYEGYRYRSGGGVLTTVPIAAFRTGDFSSLAATNPIFDPTTGGPQGVGRTQFPNNQIPANRISPIVTAILAEMPLPNVPGAGTNNNFVAPQINPLNQDLGGIRIDYVLSDATRIFGRFTRQEGIETTSVPAFGPLEFPESNNSPGNQNSAVANVTHVINPRLVVEGRFGWTYNIWSQSALDSDKTTSQDFGIPNLNNACTQCGGIAGFIIGGPVGAFSFGNGTHSHQVDNYGKYNFVEIGTWTKGKHTIKFGNDLLLAWRDRRDTSSQGDFGCDNSGVCGTNGFAQTITGNAAVPSSGLSTATFLLGDVSDFGRVIYARGVPEAHNTNNALYVQDTWHVTPKFTATLGLRWDYIGYPTSPQPGGIANFNYTNTDTIISNFGNSSSTANVNQNYGDFGPRVGFAWSVFKNTVVRGGWGRSFTNGFYGANFGAITNDWPNATRQTLSQITDLYQPAPGGSTGGPLTLASGPAQFVSGFQILAAAGNPGQYPTPNSESFGALPHNPTNSVDQWNASVQHQFGYDISLTASYVGQANRHLFYRFDANAAPPGPGPINLRQAYNSYGFTTNAYNQDNQSNAGYNALELQAQKRYSHGLVFTTAFTWSNSYDFGIHNAFDQFQTNLMRGPEDNNRTLVFVASHVWELPVGQGKEFLNKGGVVNQVVGGWKFSGIWTLESGFPFSATVANDATLNSNCCTLTPNKTGNPAPAHKGINSWFNPGAYTIPALYTEGTAGRNNLVGPGLFRADFSLQKVFKITERTNFQLQWEAYNAFNRANYSNPDGNIDDSTAGVISGVADIMRQMQFGGTLRF
jgi:hypothetical protein